MTNSNKTATQKPMTVYYSDDGEEVYGLYIGNQRVVETDAGYYPPDKEMAERLCACFNACQGLENPAEAIEGLKEAAKYALEFVSTECPNFDRIHTRLKLEAALKAAGCSL